MTPEFRKKWDYFQGGEWTKEAPTEDGIYPIASITGEQGGSIVVFLHPDGGVGYARYPRSSKKAAEIWGGFFWSRSMPELPPVEVEK